MARLLLRGETSEWTTRLQLPNSVEALKQNSAEAVRAFETLAQEMGAWAPAHFENPLFRENVERLGQELFFLSEELRSEVGGGGDEAAVLKQWLDYVQTLLAQVFTHLGTRENRSIDAVNEAVTWSAEDDAAVRRFPLSLASASDPEDIVVEGETPVNRYMGHLQRKVESLEAARAPLSDEARAGLQRLVLRLRLFKRSLEEEEGHAAWETYVEGMLSNVYTLLGSQT